MKSFQLDECANDKSIARDCNNQGLAKVELQPKDKKGMKDWEWAPSVLNHGLALVTGDKNIIEDSEGNIPDHHPGIIIFRNSDRIPTWGSKQIREILSKFKIAFEDWHEEWSNSVIYLSKNDIEVGHISNGQFVRDKFLLWSDADWQDEFRQAIQSNRLLSN